MADSVYLVAKAQLAQVLMQRAWDKGLEGDPEPPWPWADTHPIGRLSVAQHSVDQIVLAGASGRNLAFGPSFLLPSATPGSSGNTVIAGHRDTHFEFLQNLKIGSEIKLDWIDGGSTHFTVASTRVVDSRTERIDLDTTSALLTLVTCYPFDALDRGGPLRFVVEARPKLRNLDEVTPIRHSAKPKMHENSAS